MREAVELAERVSVTDANVLITGESGAGKDVLAAFIHSKSKRARQPFVKIDCATLPGDLLEAELFGYGRGAFTGASEGKPGRLEAAHKGTVVLDEIAHLSVEAQAKLLRVIEEREFERLGGRTTIRLDARLIALTNVDLDSAVERKAFREDLYYRLNVINIRVPPLRERQADLSALAQSFLERAVIFASGKRLEEGDLPANVSAAVAAERQKQRPASLAELEATHISRVLVSTNGNKSECARILGISRKNLYEKIARYKL